MSTAELSAERCERAAVLAGAAKAAYYNALRCMETGGSSGLAREEMGFALSFSLDAALALAAPDEGPGALGRALGLTLPRDLSLKASGVFREVTLAGLPEGPAQEGRWKRRALCCLREIADMIALLEEALEAKAAAGR